jgi:hypothetical protein
MHPDSPVQRHMIETPEGICVFWGRLIASCCGPIAVPSLPDASLRATVYRTAAGHAILVEELQAGGASARFAREILAGARFDPRPVLFQGRLGVIRSAWEAARTIFPDLLPIIDGEPPAGWIPVVVRRLTL